MSLVPAIAALCVVLCAFGLSTWLASSRSPVKILDHPNDRSLHSKPTPRTGGLAIVLTVAVCWALLAWLVDVPPQMGSLALAALAVAAISLADDVVQVGSALRFFVHAASAGLLCWAGLALSWPWVGVIVSLLFIVWMINLYNFMDGMDGFAGGMTFFGFGVMALAGWLAGDTLFAAFCGAPALASLGFLAVNFPPAKIFMGDVGSATLGLLAAAFSLWGIELGLFTLWFALLIFSPFTVDATVTLLRRMARREKFWQAHRSHYYQRLVQMGWSHRKTVLCEYALMAAAGGLGLLLLEHPHYVIAAAVAWTVILGAIMWGVDRRWARQQSR